MNEKERRAEVRRLLGLENSDYENAGPFKYLLRDINQRLDVPRLFQDMVYYTFGGTHYPLYDPKRKCVWKFGYGSPIMTYEYDVEIQDVFLIRKATHSINLFKEHRTKAPVFVFRFDMFEAKHRRDFFDLGSGKIHLLKYSRVRRAINPSLRRVQDAEFGPDKRRLIRTVCRRESSPRNEKASPGSSFIRVFRADTASRKRKRISQRTWSPLSEKWNSGNNLMTVQNVDIAPEKGRQIGSISQSESVSIDEKENIPFDRLEH